MDMLCMMPVSPGALLFFWPPISTWRMLRCPIAARAIELNPKYAKAYYRWVSAPPPHTLPYRALAFPADTRRLGIAG